MDDTAEPVWHDSPTGKFPHCPTCDAPLTLSESGLAVCSAARAAHYARRSAELIAPVA